MAELAAVSQSIEGVGCECCSYLHMTSFPLTARGALPDAHVYGSFNLAVGIGGFTPYCSRVLPLTISHGRFLWYALPDKPLRKLRLMFPPSRPSPFWPDLQQGPQRMDDHFADIPRPAGNMPNLFGRLHRRATPSSTRARVIPLAGEKPYI